MITGIRRSFYYIFLLTDLVMMTASFAAADLISRSRLPEDVAGGLADVSLPEIFTLLIFMVVWFFSTRVTSFYDELKNFNFSSPAGLLPTTRIRLMR